MITIYEQCGNRRIISRGTFDGLVIQERTGSGAWEDIGSVTGTNHEEVMETARKYMGTGEWT